MKDGCEWKSFVCRLLLCVAIAGFALYLYIDNQNKLTSLRLSIPMLTKELKKIQEQNVSLQYEIERFESPVKLMELARKPEFGYLKYPYTSDVIVIKDEDE